MTAEHIGSHHETSYRPGPGPPPNSPTRAWLAERVFRHAVRSLPVRVVAADGRYFGAGGSASPTMRLVRPTAFFHRLGVDAKIGFGEAYQAGDWTSDDLAGLLTAFAARVTTLVPSPLQLLRRWVDRPKPDTADNTVANARANIQHHYDLSNDLFAAFLDESMTYSAGLFDGTDDLNSAQLRKIDAMLDSAAVGSGSRVCEIGTGWGSLAIRAAQRGADVTTLTISPEQRDLAQQRIDAAGLSDRATVELCDYRAADGSYDAVVSIEMIEAVGEAYWSSFFTTLDRLLLPGGIAALQAITMPHDRMLATRRSYTWIHKYIFPGGQVPSSEAIDDHARRAGLHAIGRRRFGHAYADTLAAWGARFTAAWEDGTVPAIDERFDEVFRRTWEFYLAYSEAGFRGEYLDVRQLAFRKPG